MELLPMVERFNLWATELGKNLEGRISIEYHPLTTIHQATISLSEYNTPITVTVTNFDECRVYKWSLDIFRRRYELAEDQFSAFL
jgi:hypothetical protein